MAYADISTKKITTLRLEILLLQHFATNTTTIIHEARNDDGYTETHHSPGHDGTISKYMIHLLRESSHYSALVEGPSVRPEALSNTSFSPQLVKPYPRATVRKTTRGRKRKSSILTDTPLKQALADEKKNKKKIGMKMDTKCSKPKKRKLKPNRKLLAETDTDDETDTFCLVCPELYSNSRAKEKWVQCVYCKGWSHEECAGSGTSLCYICHNCESD